jgi:hypothetical protein
MLNLNLNIIGALQPRIDRPGPEYFVRNDLFREYIVLAMPGTLFIETSNNIPAFNMTNPWDDVSAFVRGGTNLPPSGSNIPMVYLTSSIYSASISTSSLTVFPYDLAAGSPYSGSTRLDGGNSILANRIFADGEGTNILLTKDWVMESYVAFEVTSSLTPPADWAPGRFLVWKKDPNGYWWDSNFGGAGGPTTASISGSNRFIYESADVPPAEYTVTGNNGPEVVPFEWRHYALSYTTTDRTMRMYVNQQLLTSSILPEDRSIKNSVSEAAQIMGSTDTAFFPGGYIGSATYFQDFRFYNGTNKNYTASLIPEPESIVSANYQPFL